MRACAADQHAELPEWLDYHRRLGVSHVYVMDDASQPPLEGVLAPYIEVRAGRGRGARWSPLGERSTQPPGSLRCNCPSI